ncbi:MAG: hypothetical protein ABEH83_13675 [Halobacterium sp.]
MASVSSSHLVLFIAAIIVAAVAGGTITEGATRLSGAITDSTRQQADDLASEIQVVSDAGSPQSIYDNGTGTLTLYVKNVGAETLPSNPGDVTVLVNGTYQGDMSTTVLESEEWRPDTLLRIRVNVSLPAYADTRVVVNPTGARDTFAFRTPPVYDARPGVVFTQTDNSLHSVDASGTITDYGVDATAIGPKQVDFDGDDRVEIPYVTASGTLKLVDESGETTTLATGAETNKTLLAVGEWRGATSVYYVNESDGSTLYRVAPGSSPSQMLVGGSSEAASAAAGVADLNGDGDTDLAFTGTSQGLYYVDGDAVTQIGGVGQNEGIGVGAPREFDGTATPRVPGVDGSANVALWDDTGTKTALTSGGGYPKAPVAGFDWQGDASLEVVFVENGDVKYVTLDGTVGTVVENASADSETGAA